MRLITRSPRRDSSQTPSSRARGGVDQFPLPQQLWVRLPNNQPPSQAITTLQLNCLVRILRDQWVQLPTWSYFAQTMLSWNCWVRLHWHFDRKKRGGSNGEIVGRDIGQICFSVLVVVFPIYSLQSWREVETGAMVGGGVAMEGMEQRNHKKGRLAKSSQASPEHGLVKLQVADGRASSCIFVLENAAGRHQPPVYLYLYIFVFVFVNSLIWGGETGSGRPISCAPLPEESIIASLTVALQMKTRTKSRNHILGNTYKSISFTGIYVDLAEFSQIKLFVLETYSLKF